MTVSTSRSKRLDSILDEVIAYSTSSPLAEDEFTILDYVARLCETTGTTIDESTARKRLNAQIKEGRLAKRRVVLDGIRRNAYRLAGEVDITPPS